MSYYFVPIKLIVWFDVITLIANEKIPIISIYLIR